MKKYVGEGGVPVENLKLVTEIGVPKKMPKSLSKWRNGYLIIKIPLLQILFCKMGTISNFF